MASRAQRGIGGPRDYPVTPWDFTVQRVLVGVAVGLARVADGATFGIGVGGTVVAVAAVVAVVDGLTAVRSTVGVAVAGGGVVAAGAAVAVCCCALAAGVVGLASMGGGAVVGRALAGAAGAINIVVGDTAGVAGTSPRTIASTVLSGVG